MSSLLYKGLKKVAKVLSTSRFEEEHFVLEIKSKVLALTRVIKVQYSQGILSEFSNLLSIFYLMIFKIIR